jgi:hypothetical protein
MTGFAKAERNLTNPTIAITGPTGAGKTFSALRLATGIAQEMNARFCVIDTENGSASLYSELFDFDTLNITPPFTTEKYISAIQMAEKAGYCACVCDSITHAWAGEGGLLEQKAQLDARPGSNHWTNWNPIKAKDLKFKNTYLHSTIPFFIATMRSKMEYAQNEDGGKKKVQKVGMAPVQSDGIEYEFSVVFDAAMNHECEVSKDRTHLFDQKKILVVTEETGKMLVQWRKGGKARETVKAEAKAPPKVEDEPQWHPPEESQQFESDDELDKALGVPGADLPGGYEITFGQFAGKKLKNLPVPALKGYMALVRKQAKEKGVEIADDTPVGEFLYFAEAFLGQK